MTFNRQAVIEATKVLKKGGLIAYPTESVYGLGCDPFNERAVERLLFIKKRPVAKGLIIITHDWRIVQPLVQPIETNRLSQVMATWPGPATWVFPATDRVPYWIVGAHNTIAIRITNHPIAREICQQFLNPVVSTSANLTNQEPDKNFASVEQHFKHEVDFIVQGEVGGLPNPTPIRDAITGRVLRV